MTLQVTCKCGKRFNCWPKDMTLEAAKEDVRARYYQHLMSWSKKHDNMTTEKADRELEWTPIHHKHKDGVTDIITQPHDAKDDSDDHGSAASTGAQ